MNSPEAEPVPRRRGRPADVDPDRVALLALRHFAEHGYETTTMDDIAALAGIGRRTLFRYFPSKPDLVWGGLGAGGRPGCTRSWTRPPRTSARAT
jgi:Transcriptional regulator